MTKTGDTASWNRSSSRCPCDDNIIWSIQINSSQASVLLCHALYSSDVSPGGEPGGDPFESAIAKKQIWVPDKAHPPKESSTTVVQKNTHPDLQKLNFAVAQWCKTNIHQSKGQPLHTNNSMSSAHRKTTSITDTDTRHRHRHTRMHSTSHT